jgi:hypothetical protein
MLVELCLETIPYCAEQRASVQLCVGSTELGNGARPTARGCHEDFLAGHGRGSLLSLETWELGRWIFVLRLPSQTQEG